MNVLRRVVEFLSTDLTFVLRCQKASEFYRNPEQQQPSIANFEQVSLIPMSELDPSLKEQGFVKYVDILSYFEVFTGTNYRKGIWFQEVLSNG